MNNRQPILVSGAHRSGTTWVGKMLAACDQVAYISEPLNVWHRPGVFHAPVRYWYMYICQENEDKFLPAIQETLNFDYHAWDEINSLRSVKDLLRMGRDWKNFSNAKKRELRPLLKDPFAVFSVPWFKETLNCQTVITVRHPAAYASSLKRLNWEFDFSDLLNQPLLMRDWLGPFKAEMETLQQVDKDIIGKSCLLWKMIYSVVSIYQETYPDIPVVRHEDLSIDPLKGFRLLYDSLDLNFTPDVKETIIEYSNPENPEELSTRSVHGTRLNSRANINNWKHRLTPEEVSRIRQLTAEIADIYYPEEDWI